jgi:galactosamine-6-phosphate isomerase
MLRPCIFPDHERASQFSADWLVEKLRHKPTSIVCLASGVTPMRTYALFAERAANEPSLVDQCRLLKLDEWEGLPMTDPHTCEQHLRNALVTPLGIADRYVGFDSQPVNPKAECARVAKWLDANGPIDLCVLGLGANGHIGFNEPAAFLQPHAHVVELSNASLAHSMIRHWPIYCNRSIS